MWGHVLTRLQHLLFGLLAVLLLSVNANAQSAKLDFSYIEKTQTITLAKQGNADAFYKLGLAHLHGINSPQNDALAQRFFFYATEKGHLDAKRYLEQLNATPTTPPLTEISNADAPSPQYSEPQTVDLNAGLSTEEVSVKKRATKKRDQKQVKAKTKTPSQEKVLSAVVNLTEAVKPPTPIVPAQPTKTRPAKNKKVVKLASGGTNKGLTASVARPQITQPSDIMTTTGKTLGFLKSINKYLLIIGVIIVSPIILIPAVKYSKPITNVFVICGLGIFLFFGLVFRVITKKFSSEDALPDGFSKQAYLDLNPDVRDSGTDVAQHYLKHGIHEGRKYKY